MRRELRGQTASPGAAVGPCVRLSEGVAALRAPGMPEHEAADLLGALDSAVAELTALAEQAGGEGAEILEFQVAMLEDPALREPAMAAIVTGTPADAAWRDALDSEIAGYAEAGDAYFRARAADLRDLRDRVLRHLTGAAGETEVPPGGLVLADDITPSRFLSIDWRHGGGVALGGGSPASHVAMLARARGVPMVVGLGRLPPNGDDAALDADAGLLVLSPDGVDRARVASRVGLRPAAAGAPAGPAHTASGERVRLLLNIAAPDDLAGLDPAICDGIGLVRTELLFGAGPALPDEAAQTAAYAAIARWAAGRPVTIRTLDAGGDKPIQGLTVPGESNPFLGLRGVRLSLARPEVFAVQLRALARAAAEGEIKVMLPMVTVPEELDAARALLDQAVGELLARGIPARRPALGMMVEVPAAALALDRFDAAEFFSIGTNDLTQYVTAAARDIGAVAKLADAAHPAVIRLVAEAAAYGHETGREVSVCGDAGGDPRLIPLLLAAGIRVLSMAPNALPAARAAVARFGQQGETP